MFCSNCGTQISEGSAFCPNCGARLSADVAAVQPAAAVAAAPVQTMAPQPKALIMSTLETVSGKETEILGLVKGSTASSKNVGKDLLAGFKNMAGGEIKSYTELASAARDTAVLRMMNEARALGADAVLGVRFTSAPIAVEGVVEVLVYGTAVKIK